MSAQWFDDSTRRCLGRTPYDELSCNAGQLAGVQTSELPTTARSWHQTETAVSEGISVKANMAIHSAAERL